MKTVLAILAAVFHFVVELITARNRKLEDQRVRQLEEAAANERRERLARIDEKAAAVRDTAGADELLRHVTGADDPDTN